MSVLVVPDDGTDYWPTLGWGVAEFLTGWDFLLDKSSDKFEGSVFGPGSLKGQNYFLDDEKLAAVLRAYEVFPPGHRFAGRRRFKRVVLSWRKGTAKTEWAAQICYAELHPDSPVRFNGQWQNVKGMWVPGGRPVNDPFIPMVAFNAGQAEELAYNALSVIITQGHDGRYFDVGTERILRIDDDGRPDGKAVALSGSPNANDGARTTFQHFDETHRMELPRLREAHKTMLANIPKRPLDDPWSMETTTAGRPGANSVAEATHKHAEKIKLGEVQEPRMFFFHREASPKWDLTKFDERVKAIAEATGPVGEYAPGQFEEIAAQWDDPDADRAYLERVWLNRWTRSDLQAFDVGKFRALSNVDNNIPDGAFCTLGFDGARFRDSTGFVLTEIPTGRQMMVARWERPMEMDDEDASWEVPVLEVNEKFDEIMRRWDIYKFYGDPPHWVETMATWAGKYPDKVEEWWTNNRRKMAEAARAYAEAITAGEIKPFYDEDFIRHVGNAGKRETTLHDEEGRKLWILGKLRPEAKFDIAMAGVLSWKARIDALADGAKAEESFVPYRIR